MNFSKECRSCSVELDKGTGVFFQPKNTDEYSYILTAKHNLYKDRKCLEPKNIKDIKLISFDKKVDFIILKKYELEDCSKDFAILKIKKVELFSPKLLEDKLKITDEYFLYGYPKNRRNNDEKGREKQVRNFKLKFNDSHDRNNEIIVENDSYYTQEDIAGCSGGGVFKEIADTAYLVGIECRMDKESDAEENNTRLRFFSIKAFDEIVDKYSDELVYLDENKNKKYLSILLILMILSFIYYLIVYKEDATSSIQPKISLKGTIKNRENNKTYYLFRDGDLDIKTISEKNGTFVFNDILGEHNIEDRIYIICCTDDEYHNCRKSATSCKIGEKCDIY